MDYVIIVAGGKGLRMGGEVPKQFLPIGGKPVLMRTIERFYKYAQVSSSKFQVPGSKFGIILVLPKAQQGYWKELCKQYHFDVEYQIADGGETRFHSVQNGLALIPSNAEGVVGVHDGVRPFVSLEVIERCYETARTAKAVIPVAPVVETLRHIKADGTGENVLRSDYRLVQTPQTFDIQLLKKANKQEYSEKFTDDASVVEAMHSPGSPTVGQKVTMVEGNRENIKITTPFDMKIAEALLMHNA